MKQKLIEEISRMKNLFRYERGKVISEEPEGRFDRQSQAISDLRAKGKSKEDYPECIRNFGQPKYYVSTAGGQKQYVYYIDGTGEYKNYYFYLNGKVGNRTLPAAQQIIGNYYCSNGVLVLPSEKKEETVPQNEKQNQNVVKKLPASAPNKTKPIVHPIPQELVNVDGVKKFQDWLDTNKAGWAKGYPGNVLSGGKGYGNFGPRTKKAWDLYGKNEYLKPTEQPSPISQEEIITINSADVKTTTEPTKIDPTQIKTIPQQNQQTGGISPDSYYKNLVDLNLIDPLTDESGREYNRIKFKGDAKPEVIQFLDGYLSGKGYQRLKEKNKGYGVKIVWVKK